MANKCKTVQSLSPLKELILTVLYRYMETGLYNLHVLDEIQAADRAVGKKETPLGSFYPTIKRLEEEGMIEGFWDDQEISPGVRRRYLKITGDGIRALTTNRQHRAILSGNKSIEKNEDIPGLDNTSGGICNAS